jgi:hypothetical protein
MINVNITKLYFVNQKFETYLNELLKPCLLKSNNGYNEPIDFVMRKDEIELLKNILNKS